jgi:septum formation protein
LSAGRARLVLASASPRRQELLSRLGLEFEIRAPEVDETPRAREKPGDLVARLALTKARAVVSAGELALGADTVVALGDEVLGKPSDDDDARRMLRALSGRSHEVWTGVALVRGRAQSGSAPVARDGDEGAFERHATCRTEVVFRTLAESEIADYVASGEPLDRAGAYAIQGGAARFVASYEGELDNVVGLPLALVRELLGGAGLGAPSQPPAAAADFSRRP